MKHAGEFRWACELWVDCPNCHEHFDFEDTDDFSEMGGLTVCKAEKKVECECETCGETFTFDVGAGQ